MKVIVAGGRTISDEAIITQAIKDSGFQITELVCGMASGVDLTARAILNGQVPVKEFPANWLKHGRAAGPIRNAEMANYAEALIAVWDGESRGTANMIEAARKRKLKVHVHRV